VKLWQTRVGFSRITAPISGVVTARHVESGSTVQPNQRLFDVADVSLLVVQVRVSELDVVTMKQGDRVEVTLDAFPDETIEGTIRRIFPVADAASRLVPVEIALGRRSAGVNIKPGYLARVRFATDTRAAALVVPAASVGTGEKGAFVYVVSGDTLARRNVVVGMTADTWVEVIEGLQYGERVVSSGHSGLRPGAKVRVTEGAGAEAKPAEAKNGGAQGGTAQ
jgi:membrane fusion protein, multidrug efflux system